MCRCDWIEWKGSKYYRGDYVLCGFQENDLPQFGKVYDMILAKEETFLCITVYITEGIDTHYHSYVILPSPEKRLIYVNEESKLLGTLHPLRSHFLRATPRKEYLVTKCIVIRT